MTSTITDKNGGTTSASPTTSRDTGLRSSAAVKGPCRVASTSNITLSGTQTIDGVAVAAGDRVLVTGQTNTINNGIYIAAATAWYRAPDFSRNDDVRKGTEIRVNEGSANSGVYVVSTADASINIGTSAIAFSLQSAPTGALLATNNLSDVASSVTSYNNIAKVDTATYTPAAGVLDLSASDSLAENVAAGTISSITVGSKKQRIIRAGGTLTFTASSSLIVNEETAGSFIFLAGSLLEVFSDGTNIHVTAIYENKDAKGAAIASASTVTLGRQHLYHITGSVTITDIDWSDAVDGSWAWLYFDAAPLITYNATTLLLPSGASIQAAAGDRMLVAQDSGDNVIVLDYIRASGEPVTGAKQPLDADLTLLAAQSWTQLFGFRNRLINGQGQIDQRVYTTVADDTYWCDRHYVLTQTSTVTPSILSGPAPLLPTMMRLTQSQASAQRMGNAQIIENRNCRDLRSQPVTLLGKLRCSSSQAIRYAILEWTGTQDAPTSDVVNDWTSGTYTAGNFFNSTTLTVTAVGSITPSAATVTDFLLTGTLGSSFTNIIVMIWTEGTAAQNVTLDVAWELHKGDMTGQTYPLEVRSKGQEQSLCERYFQTYGGDRSGSVIGNGRALSTTQAHIEVPLRTKMRSTAPAVSVSAASDWSVLDGVTTTACTAVADVQSDSCMGAIVITVASGLTQFRPYQMKASTTTNARLNFDAEL